MTALTISFSGGVDEDGDFKVREDFRKTWLYLFPYRVDKEVL